MKRALALTASLVAAGALVNSQAPASRPQLVTRDAYLMGTRAHLATYTARRADGVATLDVALRVLESTEGELSTWRSDSAISSLNRQPVGEAWQATASTCRMLERVFGWQVETGGTFDPGIGRLIEAWNIHGEGNVPSPAQLTQAVARSGLSLLSFDRHRCTVTRQGDATIDVGAFGKGEALDRVETALGQGAWLVDLGGQVTVGGPQPDGSAWTVDVAHPAVRHRAQMQVSMREGSLSTSGGSERDLVVDGTRIGHLLDPRTGRPAAYTGSVTVWHRSGLAADALTTALYVMGPDEGLRWAEARGIAAMFLVPERDGVKALATAAWRKRERDTPALQRSRPT